MTNNKKVIKIQCPFERIKKYNSSPESGLYKAVIMQMIIDASNSSSDPKACRNERRAKAWLFGGGEDFQIICRMANIEPNIVVTFAKTLIAIHAEKSKVLSIKRKKLNSCCGTSVKYKTKSFLSSNRFSIRG